MQVSKPNQNGVLETGRREVVATYGRFYAAVELALCEDGLYRFSVELFYSYGGFCGPISDTAEGYATEGAARTAALEELLRKWHRPFPSDPASVHEELRVLREQVEGQLCQPSLF
jgi:hypothetical protein